MTRGQLMDNLDARELAEWGAYFEVLREKQERKETGDDMAAKLMGALGGAQSAAKAKSKAKGKK